MQCNKPKCLEPSGLYSREHFGCMEEFEMLVVRPNSGLVIGTFKVKKKLF